ncbi:hypothetical protein D5R40_07525 [Okeania hirsuta]|uniref:Uncharacterized protein n=1 Tax=Okeania hirsuta TaxID=1458930 RepID=A0A3N6QQ15_9CYAN|nr:MULTISPECIES: hypothetical protein [Okeania]NES91327.1 hypothetical protein [Okeania sp. SIO2B9]NET76175.1 hypothetical protein [Okeania sp. SIO1F9]RQH19385.1 hypothetical protein D4Z78_13890 [Okeania hirsuta]RQH49060.1 hypothetical protein D5R40_07525 [Okeania hirsuta]
MSNLSYSKFTLEIAKTNFELTLEENQDLFAQIKPVKPSEILTTILREYIPLATAINTEKARSELLISQILADVRRQLNYRISLFSGTEFNVEAELGLQGYCDFLLSFSPEQYFITAPVITIVEAKNENIIRGLGQCVASMVGAQFFNQRADNPVKVIYGAVTTGTNWKFLTLEEKIVRIDVGEYYVKEIDKILGIILEPFREYLEQQHS